MHMTLGRLGIVKCYGCDYGKVVLTASHSRDTCLLGNKLWLCRSRQPSSLGQFTDAKLYFCRDHSRIPKLFITFQLASLCGSE